MTDDTLQAAVEDDYETELSRLGSSKALYAITEGEMETASVLSNLADRMAAAAETFDGWAREGGGDEVFATAAGTAGDLAERVAGAADDAEPTASPTPVDEVLRDLEGADARLGGLLAWTMITDRTLAQAVGFFVGNADTTAADLFRGLRTDVEDLRVETAGRLGDADAEAARGAANEVVEAAYTHYVETLEGMGVKVKPVC
jgi:hypothetical protein